MGSVGIDENKLTKGQVRKLNALRKYVGEKLGEEVSASVWHNRRKRRPGRSRMRWR